jgi:hypothetical protein
MPLPGVRVIRESWIDPAVKALISLVSGRNTLATAGNSDPFVCACIGHAFVEFEMNPATVKVVPSLPQTDIGDVEAGLRGGQR